MFKFSMTKAQVLKAARFASFAAGVIGLHLSFIHRDNETLIQIGNKEFTITKADAKRFADRARSFLSEKLGDTNIVTNPDSFEVNVA
jgi:hypothetical protein